MSLIFLYCSLVLCCLNNKINGLQDEDGGDSVITTKINRKSMWNSTYSDKLRHDLFLNYDKFARPSQHYNKTKVYFGLTIGHLEVNEFKSTLTLFGYAQMTWMDKKLIWNSSDYGDLSVLHISEVEVWQPDIFLYNSAISVPLNQYANTPCLLYPFGEVLWVPPAQFAAVCHFKLTLWPFDTQTCTFVFGSWTYHGDEVDILLRNNKTSVDLDSISLNGEWKIVEAISSRSVGFYPCCEEGYPQIRVNVTIQRMSPLYQSFVITPTICIVMLTLLCFWLPPQAGEKLALNGCLIVAIILILLYFAQKIPPSISHTPLIVYFYSSTLYVVCFTMLNSVLVIWLARTQHTKSLHWLIKKPLHGLLGKCLGLGHYITEANMKLFKATAQEMHDHQVTDYENHDTANLNEANGQRIRKTLKAPLQHDWLLLAVALDRIAFIIFSMLFVILAKSYSI